MQDKYSFLNDLIVEIKQRPINEVIGLYLHLVQRGPNFLALCPFHADTHLGSFVVSPNKGIWKCFACGEHGGVNYAGDAIKFVRLYKKVSYFEAALDIAVQLRLISLEQYETYSRKRYDPKRVEEAEKKYSEARATSVEQPEQAPAEVKDKVYRAFKEAAGLDEEDRQYLRSVRGLSDERIDADYFTFPSNWRKKAMIISLVMEKTGITSEELSHVPGFFIDKEYNMVSIISCKGIGILLHNPDGTVPAIQIRKKTVEKGEQRYVWFSSSFAANSPDKFGGGCGTGSPKDVLWPSGDRQSRCICITEGRFKSEVLSKSGNTVVSVQGVATWRGCIATIKDIVKIKPGFYTNIFLFFDSDLFGNPPLMEQVRLLVSALHKTFPRLSVVYAAWHKAGGKGIDDYIAAEGTSSIKFLHADFVISKAEDVFNGEKRLKDVRTMTIEQRKELAEELQARVENVVLH